MLVILRCAFGDDDAIFDVLPFNVDVGVVGGVEWVVVVVLVTRCSLRAECVVAAGLGVTAFPCGFKVWVHCRRHVGVLE